MTGTAQQPLTAAAAWLEVVTRNISVTPAFDGRVWLASVDVFGQTISTKRRKVRMVTAVAATPMAAVAALLDKLEGDEMIYC